MAYTKTANRETADRRESAKETRYAERTGYASRENKPKKDVDWKKVAKRVGEGAGVVALATVGGTVTYTAGKRSGRREAQQQVASREQVARREA